MAKKKRKPRQRNKLNRASVSPTHNSVGRTIYCDTTIIYYELLGHDLQKLAIAEYRKGSELVISNFVRGEFIRGFISSLIEVYFCIKDEKSLHDGFAAYCATSSHQPRKIINHVISLSGWLMRQEDQGDLSTSLRRLGEYIKRMIIELDYTFPKRCRDKLCCDFGVMSMPSESFSENQLVDFYEELSAVTESPNCKQCGFREEIRSDVRHTKLFSDSSAERLSSFQGYIKQVSWMKSALASKMPQPSCNYCQKLGDTIIALSAPKDSYLLTGDANSYPALCEILELPFGIIPSLNKLKKES
jgi:hypothetical protein